MCGDGRIFIAVSPFERTIQTLYGMFAGGFPRKQVGAILHDPRIREQEFGNLQSQSLHAKVKAEVRRWQQRQSDSNVVRVWCCCSSDGCCLHHADGCCGSVLLPPSQCGELC